MKKRTSSKQTLQEGAYLLIVTALLTKIISAVFKIPLSSNLFLGDLGFGYFSAAHDLLTPVITLALSGFPVAVSYFISYYVSQNDFSSVGQVIAISKRFLIKVSVLGFVLMGLFIYPYMKLTSSTFEYIYGLLAILPAVLFCGILSLYRGYFQGFLNMKPYAISNLIEAVVKLVLGFSLSLIILNITGNLALAAAGALFGITLGIAFSTFYIYIKYKKQAYNYNFKSVNLKAQDTTQLKRNIVVLSLTVAVSSLTGCIVAFIDTVTVRPILNDLIINNTEYFKREYGQLLEKGDILTLPTVLYGIRSKAFSFFNIIISLCMALGVSVVPNISETNDEKSVTTQKISTSLRLTSLITFPSAFGFIFLGKRIMVMMFGEGFSAAVGGNILMLYGIATFFAGFSIVIGNILQSRQKHYVYLIAIISAAVIKLILNFTLGKILSLNIYANVIATIVFFAIIFTVNIIVLCNTESKELLKGIFIKPLFVGLLCGVSAYLISQIGTSKIFTILAIIVAALVYFVFLVITRFFKEDDFLSLPGGKNLVKVFKKKKFSH